MLVSGKYRSRAIFCPADKYGAAVFMLRIASIPTRSPEFFLDKRFSVKLIFLSYEKVTALILSPK